MPPVDPKVMTPQSAAEKAVSVLGYGYDLSKDIRLSSCKPGPSGSRLIELDEGLSDDLFVPGGVVIPNVSKSIKCDKGERTRFRSDVLAFHQMSEHFNQELSLSGKIPSGLFNAMFDFRGCWQKDASSAKHLAFDGWFITLYSIELARSQIVLHDRVKQDVPSYWDPAALAEFIEKYGTHIIIGVKMGGKDVFHIKQLQGSLLQPTEVQNLLKNLADGSFSEDSSGSFVLDPDELSRKLEDKHLAAWEHRATVVISTRSSVVSHSKKDDIVSNHVRRGGIDGKLSHNQWLSTISHAPDVISMSFVPITSLLNGVRGSGFLSHAVNLYLRYKPPIEELHQFLEFQLPRQWAPVFSELSLGPRNRKHGFPSLQFTIMGPKLYINNIQVDSGNRPVTGIRLYLEGKKNDCLAVHLQHLSSLPATLQLTEDTSCDPEDTALYTRAYYEPVTWALLSHVCTAPIQYNGAWLDDSASIVTKAWLEVKELGMRKVLFLRLGFSTVASAKIRRSEWEGPTSISRKSGSISALFSTRFSTSQIPPLKPAKVELNSAVYPGGPPIPVRVPRMTKFVDSTEMTRGAEDHPGYWVVTGAKLCVDGGKISLNIKYSLLIVITEDEI